MKAFPWQKKSTASDRVRERLLLGRRNLFVALTQGSHTFWKILESPGFFL